ncbi:disintegrin and metalloproteinase domain-containing protein 28 [Ornithorhynchus anatinus]|uniref:disintegrin and metalloproteinase domain-containing protein 28 n=1 Tax=Ornithorhynchus anatinus TaxID=9258 RepID=UPI0019D4B165|nr:disintegrin and metalloproteinase domain-containing protein 28 [Ornithorhynchus anatinus]
MLHLFIKTCYLPSVPPNTEPSTQQSSEVEHIKLSLLNWVLNSSGLNVSPIFLTVWAIKEVPGIEDYEVVYPEKLHVLHKRNIEEHEDPDKQEKYEPEVQYRIMLHGEGVVLHLEKAKELLSPDYTETFYSSTGEEVTTGPQITEHCYYQGHILNEEISSASISTCAGLRGYFKLHDQRYLIEPLKLTDQEEHAVFKYNHMKQDTINSTCAVNDSGQRKVEVQVKASRSGVSLGKDQYMQQKKYVEFFLVLDNTLYQRYGPDQDELRKRVFDMINFVSMVYKSINVLVELVGIETWTDADKIKVNPDASITLELFKNWRRSVLPRRKKHDIAQLLTGVVFSEEMVGLAFVGTVCSPFHSVGVIQDHSQNRFIVAGTIAHEMGHNFGMTHDTDQCKCPTVTCVMDRALSNNIPRGFSSCSQLSFKRFLSGKIPACIIRAPNPKDIISTPICGNLLLEVGEDCDCGTPKECTNNCCVAKTCKLKAGGQCADGECCENCQIRKAGTLCRPVKDDCDLPEVCDGQSRKCPVDNYQVNGFPCQNGKGYCFMGKCPTLQKQCATIWGEGVKAADAKCYEMNKVGLMYGHCKKINNSYVPCQPGHYLCGKLFCSGGSNSLTWEGSVMTFTTCKTFNTEKSDQNIDMVANGTKCGAEKVCSNGECVDLAKTYKSANCSSKCKGHAVCNHKLKCQCEEGWAPPDCKNTAVVMSE